jgi:hypothetical protein
MFNTSTHSGPFEVLLPGNKADIPKEISWLKLKCTARCWWLMLIILATWEAEIRKIILPSQPRQIVHETLA